MKMKSAVLAAAVCACNAHAANELKIGYLSTLSGPAGAIGVEIRDGFNLALKMAGGKLGGLPTEVVFADDTLNPETGKQLAERLIKRDRVNLMTGVVFSNVMLAVWPTIQSGKTFYIAPERDADAHLRRGLQSHTSFRLVAERGLLTRPPATTPIEGLQERLPDRAQLSRGQGRHPRASSAATAARSPPRSTPS